VNFSFEEEIVYEYVKLIEQEKSNMRQLVDYLSKSEKRPIVKNPSMLKIFNLLEKVLLQAQTKKENRVSFS